MYSVVVSGSSQCLSSLVAVLAALVLRPFFVLARPFLPTMFVYVYECEARMAKVCRRRQRRTGCAARTVVTRSIGITRTPNSKRKSCHPCLLAFGKAGSTLFHRW